MRNELLGLLSACDGVYQRSVWHPEGDLLVHLLQTYQVATDQTEDWELRAAALLHDVGKVVSFCDHAQVGAELIDGIMSPRVIWLVQHHQDLQHHPKRTRQELAGSSGLVDLQLLRRWDCQGRSPVARVTSAAQAVCELVRDAPRHLVAGYMAPCHHEMRKELL